MTSLRAIAIFSALAVAPSAASAQGPAGSSGDAARIDGIFAPWSSSDSPGCAVGVSREGRPVLSRAYGMADLEHGAPNTPAAIFEAGSVSKQFTTAAILLLAEEGKLSLDDDVRTYVPELPEYEAPITIHHLIHHTSGLRDWGTVSGAAGWPRTTRAYTHEHVLDVLSRQRSLNYTPGAEYSYTNSGFNLMAIIVGRVSGMSFADFTRERLFEPLGMRSTQWRDDFTRIVPGRATAYTTARDSTFRILMPFENVHGNGGLLTTVGDLLTWNRNLETGDVGGRALIEAMHRQGRLNDGREIAYAGGLMVGSYRGVPEVSHGGATAGYRAFLTRFPEQDLSVAVLCNTTNVNAGALAHRTAEVFVGDAMGPEPSRAAGKAVAPETLAARAGLYRSLRTQEPVRLSVREGRLVMGRGTPLTPLSATELQVGSGGDRLEFSPAGGSGPTAARLRSADGDVVELERVAEASPTPAQLREYEGVYHSDEAEVAYTATVADGVLRLVRRPGAVIELDPAYADAFTARSGWLVRFIRDEDGQVREMSFGMGRVRDLRFTRSER